MMNAFTINPSALAYLFGDRLEDLFAGRSRLPFNETLPCREVKVKARDLPIAMLTTALIHLVRRGVVRLSLDSKGRILKKRFVLATITNESAANLGGLEGQILGSITMMRSTTMCPLWFGASGVQMSLIPLVM